MGYSRRPVAGIANTLKRMTQTTRGRVGLLVAILGVVWLGSALFAHLVLGQFGTIGDALWSGVTHLLDPSSLHGDHGFEHRAVGLFQVVFGLIFLVGLAFTVISEVVGRSLERLGQYDAPLRVSDHLLLIGGPDALPGYVPHLAAAHGRRVGT